MAGRVCLSPATCGAQVHTRSLVLLLSCVSVLPGVLLLRLQARAVVVDMEEGVINNMLKVGGCVVWCAVCCVLEQESPGPGRVTSCRRSCCLVSSGVSVFLPSLPTHTHISHARTPTYQHACPRVQGPLSELFDQQQLLYDVSGAGNNWAHGHHGYGPQYRDSLCEQLRRAAEDADSLQVGWVGRLG